MHVYASVKESAKDFIQIVFFAIKAWYFIEVLFILKSAKENNYNTDMMIPNHKYQNERAV